MPRPVLSRTRPAATAALCVVAVVSAITSGCDAPPADFDLNLVYVRNQQLIKEPAELQEEAIRQQLSDVADILTAYFGTPDAPQVPSLPEIDFTGVLDQEKLQVAAGPVRQDEVGRSFGLYREHCAHCHGVTGDGQGPTAPFLNPYPRDYRRGLYKFKSTPSTLPPTNEDLHKILIEGVSGTAMPSFRLLAEDEREALVQYVRYLSLRGEVERNMIMFAATDLDPGQRLLDLSLRTSDPDEFQTQLSILEELVLEIVEKWMNANGTATEVPPPPADWDSPESVAAGKALFYTTLANCAKCHGDTALGDGQVNEYDEWTKEIEPGSPEALEHYLALGALPPRNILPRNLRQGIYRGGRRPVDLYWRVKNGIAASGMPQAAPQLSSDDIWRMVDYVRSLPYESISNTNEHTPDNMRERL